MDLAAVIGLLVGLAALFHGLGGHIAPLGDGTAVVVVLLGGLAATFVAFPLSESSRLLRLFAKALVPGNASPSDVVERLVGFGEKARAQGILSLEEELAHEDDPALASGTRLAVDGTEPALIMDILETELRFMEERHKLGSEVLAVLGRNWAIFGVLGALIVLVDPAGAGLALMRQVATPLLLGGVLAGFVALPLSRKLGVYSQKEVLRRRMIIEGIMAIQSGDNPRIIEHKLSVFLAPKERPTARAPSAAPARPELPGDAGEGGHELARYVEEHGERIIEAVRQVAEADIQDESQKATILRLAGTSSRKELPVTGLLAAAMHAGILARVTSLLKGQPESPGGQVSLPEIPSFGFEDVSRLSEAEIQTFLRAVDQRDLVLAMKGASVDWRDRILWCMSPRVATFIREELAYLGHVDPTDILEVQARVVAQVLHLAAQGRIALPPVQDDPT